MSGLDARVEQFGALLTRKLGIRFEQARTEALAELLRSRADTHEIDAYLFRLEGPEGLGEVRRLAQDLTVGETYFFRNANQLQAFEEVALPACVQAQSARREIRILSAGCASGEEAYSLAIALRRSPVDLGSWTVKLKGIDVNPLMIAKALQARYSMWSLRETTPDLRERYFRPDGRDYLLDAKVRSMVSFEERNLVDDAPLFWQKDAFDIVFCRNVIMYFAPDAARAVVARIAKSLSPAGFLFLGHAETLRGISQEFHVRHTHDAFYYQRRDDSVATRPPAPDTVSRSRPSLVGAAAPSSLDSHDASWVTVIQRASERVARLARAPSSPASTETVSAVGSNAVWDLRPAVELLRRERFADAMALLQALPAESRSDPDAQILRAVLLTNSGKLSDAEMVCTQILAADDLHAGARYLMALCREHEGDRAAALEHDRVASYVDAGFAMPHLHLGLLARRAGEVDRARQELNRAIDLLELEDGSRILLFGGGFTREALIDLCRNELRACGGGS
jgi:chemotaxis protein methyltransferase CheR